jgi:hypothetical protein
MSKTTIYVVTEGSYSDYGIKAMFSTKAGAEAYIEQIKAQREVDYADTNIEQWQLDQEVGWVAKTAYRCAIDVKTGEVTNEWEFREIVAKNKRTGDAEVRPNGQFLTVLSYVSADHARKLAVEARQKHLREKA